MKPNRCKCGKEARLIDKLLWDECNQAQMTKYSVICDCGKTTKWFIFSEIAVARWNFTNDGWVSVENPPEHPYYLTKVYSVFETKMSAVQQARYLGHGTWVIVSMPDVYAEECEKDITHWHDLLEPPNENKP